MCYLARHHIAAPEDDAATSTTTQTPSVRPRWVGAAAAVIVSGVALAALLAPAVPKASAEQAPAGSQPVASSVPATPVAERSGLAPDDGVPTSTGTTKAALGHCDHGM